MQTTQTGLLAISNSEIGTFDRCLRQWYLKYYLGLVPAHEPSAGNRNLGTRVHVAMEARFHGLDPLAVLELLYGIELDAHPDEAEKLLPELDLARIMIEGYLEWAAETGDEADWEVVAAETDLRVPLPSVPGVELRVRMDQVARRISDGALAFRDWKTSGVFDKHENLYNDPQMRFYCMVQQMSAAGRQGAPLVAGGRITTFKRVKRTAKAEPPFYRSDDFWFNPDVLDSTYQRVTKICGDILAMRNRLENTPEIVSAVMHGDHGLGNGRQRRELPPTWLGNECSWACPFSTGLCTAMDDGSDWPGIALASGRYKIDDPYAYYERNPLATIREAIVAAQEQQGPGVSS
jgi:hypothetical protein